MAVFATILLGIAVTDAKHYLIPDGFTITGLLFGGVASLLGVYLGAQDPFASPVDALFGACVGAGAVTIIGWLGEVALKKEAMGFGDTTLMAMVGVALGPGRSLLTIFVGAFFAAAVVPARSCIPSASCAPAPAARRSRLRSFRSACSSRPPRCSRCSLVPLLSVGTSTG